MLRISEQIQAFIEKDLVSYCEHLSVTHWVSLSMNQWFLTTLSPLRCTICQRSFPAHGWKGGKYVHTACHQADRPPQQACRFTVLKRHSRALWGTWTCRNLITISMHEFRAKHTVVERVLWTRAIMSMSSLPEVLLVVSKGQQTAAEITSFLQQLRSVWPSD